MRIIKLLLISLLINLPAGAGETETKAFEFLRTGFHPRGAAMANAFTTMRDDIGFNTVNPAGMADLDQTTYSNAFTNYLLDINGGYAAFGFRREKLGYLSVSATFMNYGEFKETDENAVETGQTFSANDLALTVGLADTLGQGFKYGLNCKYIYSDIQDYNASAYAFDFGLLYKAKFQEDLYIGVALLNVGQNFEYYGSSREALPMTLRGGFSKKLAHLPLELAFSFTNLNQNSNKFFDRFNHFAFGGEFTVSPSVRLRMGYDNQIHSSLNVHQDSRFAGVSGGLGIITHGFRLDYSYSAYGFLGSTHRFGISGTL